MMNSVLGLLLVVATQAPSSAPSSTPSSTPSAPGDTVAAEPSNAPKVLRLAVYDLAADNVEPELARFVTECVVVELRKLKGVVVVSLDEVRSMLEHEANKQLTGCSDDSCLSEISEALGVDGLVVGRLAEVGGERTFVLRYIDTRESKTLGTSTQRLTPANGEEFLAAVGSAVSEIFPERELKAGAERGVEPELALRLNPPPLPPWVFITATGTAAAALSAGLVAGTLAAAAKSDHDALIERSRQEQVSGALVVQQRSTADNWSAASNVALGAAVVVGAGAAVALLFTDWRAGEGP